MYFKRKTEFLSKDFFRYFVYFCCVSLSIVFVFSFCNKIYFSDKFREQSSKANENTLIQLRNATDIIMSDINNSFISVIFDPTFSNYKNSYSTFKKMEITDKLENIVASNKYFLDISIYYPEEDTVVSSKSGIRQISEYYDREYILGLVSEKSLYNHAQLRTKYDITLAKDIDVISMAKAIPLNATTAPVAIIVVDIETASLNKAVKSIKADGLSSVVITNSDGNVITQSNNLSSVDFKWLYSKGRNTTIPHSFVSEVNGEKMFISQLSSDSYKWRYFYLTPVSVLEKPINKINGFIILLSLFVLLISTVIIYILTHLLYNPIREIARRFSASSEGVSDIELINENVDKLINLNQDLNILLSDYNLHLRSRYLSELLIGDYEDVDSIEKSLAYYNVDVDISGSFIVLALSIDTPNESENGDKHSKKQKDTFIVYIHELITNEILSFYRGFTVAESENLYIIALNFEPANTRDEIFRTAYEISYKVSSLFSANLNYAFTIGVGNICNGITNISTSYKEAVFALNHKFISGYNNHIMLYENINSSEKAKNYPYDIEKKIQMAMRAVDKEGLHQALHQFASHLIDNSSDAEIIRLFFLQLLTTTLRCMYEMNIEFSDIELSQDKIYSDIFKAPTIDCLLSHISTLYDAIIDYESAKRETANKDILASINEYIHSNLNEDLSINRLAEIFYLSPSYLRKIYKDEFSVTLKQHIDSERIEFAKILLEDSDIKMSDIPEKIGYLSSNSFSRAFKSHTGITPGDYRTTHQRKRIKENNNNSI